MLAGVDPAQVRLLGVNGGDLSGFEFRLAIAMGATVGLLEDSGRAVSTLLTDPDWKRLGTTAALLNEAETIAPFINVFCQPLHDVPADKIEELAVEQHHKYFEGNRTKKDYIHPSMMPWENLAEVYKESNRQQVAYADRILRSMGFAIAPIDDPRHEVVFDDKNSDDNNILEKMARMEHGRWNAERLAQGWQYGTERSLEKKTSPYLLPWEKLPVNIQKYDFDPFIHLPEMLAAKGLKIVELPKQNDRSKSFLKT